MERKSFIPQLEGDDGYVRAVIATLNVKDLDNDVTLAGAFGSQAAPLLVGHDWGSLPIGKGVVTERDNEAVFEGQFNLNSSVGKDAYETAKFQGELQQWSYGYIATESKKDSHDGSPVRVLQKVGVQEVSMVPMGAGVGTRTEMVKSYDFNSVVDHLVEMGDEDAATVRDFLGAPKEMRFVEEAQHVVTSLKTLAERAEAIRLLRDDSRLGADSVEELKGVLASMVGLSDALASVVDPGPNEDELNVEFLRYQREIARLQGVPL